MSKQTLNVLVVEDDPVDFMSVKRALSHRHDSSYSLARAESMESGKRMLEARDFDALLLDLGLPDAQGVDSVINFNASAPATPIVVLSGQEGLDVALGAVGMGAEDFLPKKRLDGRLLEEKIRFAVERHQSRLRRMGEALVAGHGPGQPEQPPAQLGHRERAHFLNDLKGGLLAAVASPVHYFSKDEAAAFSLGFAFQPGAQRPDESLVPLAKLTGSLQGLTLASVHSALEFSRSFPEARLHMDLEVEVLNLGFIRELLGALDAAQARAKICFFLPTDFHKDYREKAFRSVSTLIKAGVDVGIRDAGGGGTVIENIMLLSPSWIRLSPLLCQGISEFKIKRDYLRLWVSLLGGLHAPLLAGQASRSDFLTLAELGLAGAVLK